MDRSPQKLCPQDISRSQLEHGRHTNKTPSFTECSVAVTRAHRVEVKLAKGPHGYQTVLTLAELSGA